MKNILIILGLLICGITYSQQSRPSKPKNYIDFHTFNAYGGHAIFLDDSTLLLTRFSSSSRYSSYSTFEEYKRIYDEERYVSYTPKDVIKLKEMFVKANELSGYAFGNDITTPFQKSLGYINGYEHTFSYVGNSLGTFTIYATIKYEYRKGRYNTYEMEISDKIFDSYYQYHYDLKQYKIQLKEFNEKTERDLELINKIK